MKLTKIQREIVKAIRQLHRQGEPLNIPAVKRRHPELMAAVYALKPYWGWKQALADAGLGYADIKAELQDFCVCEICKAELQFLGSHLKQKHGTNASEYLMDYPGAELVSEDRRARQTIRGAKGLPHWEKLWTSEYVLDQLWERYKRKLPLSCRALARQDGGLQVQAVRRFESYDNALRQLGINPQDIRGISIPLKTKQEVLDRIFDRLRSKLTLQPAMVHSGNPDSDHQLYSSAHRLFGSYRKAIQAAGLDYDTIRVIPRYPTPERVIEQIQRRQRSGLPLSPNQVLRGSQRDGALLCQALKFFRSWRKAVVAAGIRYRDVLRHERHLFVLRMNQKRKYPTKEAVIAEIQRRQQTGLSIRFNDVVQGPDRDPTLCWSARQYFRKWTKAVKCAGVPYPAPRKYPTKEAVIAEIKQRQKNGLSIRSNDVVQGPDRDPTLCWSARQYFRKWAKAVKCAGVPYPTPRKYPTKEAVIAEIQRRQQAGLSIRATDVNKGPDRDPALCWSARQYFGKWAQAVQSAGLPYPSR